MDLEAELSLFPFKQNLEIYIQTDYRIDFNKDKTMCDRCKFNSSNNLANSSNHDVVISYTTSRPFNIVIFIRTLRQTGSNCSVVFFVTDEFLSKVSNDTKNYVLKCGGQFINYHQPTYTELEDD